jgi:hypothetical protein
MNAVQICELFGIRLTGKNAVQVGHHVRGTGRLLIKILLRTPDSIVLYRTEISENKRFFREL